MNLAEKFNITNVAELFVANKENYIESWKKSEHVNAKTRLAFIASDTHHLALGLYLLGRTEESFYTIQNILPITLEYLMGDWQKKLLTDRKTIDPQWWHSVLVWYHRFREDLMWLSAIGNFEGCFKILKFIDENCEDGMARSFGKKYYIGLRTVVETGNQSEYENIFNEVIQTGSKKYQQLAKTILSILSDDNENVKKHWISVLKTWKEKEAKTDGFLAREATFLYHFAAWKGITIDVPAEMLDHVVRFPNELIKR